MKGKIAFHNNTYSGKMMKKNYIDFILEGSKIENEYPNADKRILS